MGKILSRFRRSKIDQFLDRQRYEVVAVSIHEEDEILSDGEDYLDGGVVSFDAGVNGDKAVFDIEVTANTGVGPVTSISIANPGSYETVPDNLIGVPAVSAGG